MTRRVLRYEVPVDDQWHRIEIVGHVAHVGCRETGVVEFWVAPGADIRKVSTGGGELLSADYRDTNEKPDARWYRVYGTGHEVDGLYVGTTRDFATDRLIWHLFVRETEQTS